MKNIVSIILACLVVMSSMTSCEKMLDVTPQSSITEETYFKNEGDFEPYVTGIYSSMRGFVNTVTYGTERGEELVVASNARFSTAWNHILSPTVGTVNYNSWYVAIGHCNLLLHRIRNFNFTNTATRDRIMAETYALRGFFYFNLTRVIGDAPLMLVPVLDENVPLLSRSPKADVANQILSDLDSSILLFSGIPGFSPANYDSKYRFGYGSVQALKADLSLWRAKVTGAGQAAFNDAIAAVSEVESTGVQLNANFKNVTGIRAASNPEVIIASYFNRDELGGNYAVNALPFEAIVTGSLNLDSLPWAVNSGNAQGAYQISPLSRSLFSEFPEDKRIPYTWITQRTSSGNGISWITKYPGTKYADDRFPDNDLILYRLADIYLMKAEAYVGLGNTSEALRYLNLVRSRAGIPDYGGPVDQISLERAILDERGRELFFENKRWFDLVRFHLGGTLDIYSYIPNLIGKTTPLFWPINNAVLS